MQPQSRFKQNQHLYTEDSLLDTAIGNTVATGISNIPVHLLEHFLKEKSEWKLLRLLIEFFRKPGAPNPDKRAVTNHIQVLIASFDDAINKQINKVIHHKRFQKLEASWRGLYSLVEQSDYYDTEKQIKIRALDISWKELSKDLDKAIDFDQSNIFNLIYSSEFDTPGGEPYGLILGDYEISHKVQPGIPYNDTHTLRALSAVTGAAFAPFIGGAHPSLLGLDDFSELGLGANISSVFDLPEYASWRSLRSHDDSRYLGLTVPKVLMRPPYEDDGTRADSFCFREETHDSNKDYLWGNAIYAFGSVTIRAFANSGWFANIRGFQRGVVSGGLVTDLMTQSFSTDKKYLITKPSTDTLITDRIEKELSEQGLIPLSYCKDTENLVFYSNNSLQLPIEYDKISATVNARLSAMLQYILCVSRFAHYIKVIARDKIGSFAKPKDCEDYLQRWLLGYATANDDSPLELKAKHPLREAKVQVKEQPGNPGNYLCITHLQPHFQLDQLVSSIKMVTDIPADPSKRT